MLPNCKEILSQDKLNDLLKDAGCGPKLVVIDFHAKWCKPCEMIKPHLDKLAADFPDDISVLSCDVDECAELAESLGIQCMPTFYFYKNGEKVDEFSGANKDKLAEYITRLK